MGWSRVKTQIVNENRHKVETQWQNTTSLDKNKSGWIDQKKSR